MADWTFHTPGWADQDLPAWIHREWHQWHTCRAMENLEAMRALVPGADPSSIPYVNPVTGEVPAQRKAVPVEWEGFPAQIKARFDDPAERYRATVEKGYDDIFGPPPEGARFALVDAKGHEVDCRVRQHQDEYLEWEARVEDGVLRSMTFVAEGYDYWRFLFDRDPERVAQMYGELTGVAGVTPDDLRFPADLDRFVVPLDGSEPERVERAVFRRGQFNARNRLNQGPGIVHLSHNANSLGAEINLAVTSSLPRRDAAGHLVPADPVTLMCCTGGGDPNRSSDPHIGAAAYAQVVDKDAPQFFTLTDPVGLYIRSFKHTALQDPGGREAPYEFWSVKRGKDASVRADRRDSRILRLHLEVPPDEPYELGQMLVDGEPIVHPSQLADLVDMHLLVDLWQAPAEAPQAACEGTCCETPDGVLVPTATPSSCARNGWVDAFPGLVDAGPVRAMPAGLPARR